MFAVLSNKDESTYTFLLQPIKQALPELQTSAGSVMLDFEKATMKASNTVMPSFRVRNCFSTSAKMCRRRFL